MRRLSPGAGTKSSRKSLLRPDGRSLSAIVSDVNRSLRGWHGCFQHSKASTFTAVHGHVRRRLRSLLQWDWMGWARGSEPPINAGRRMVCAPWAAVLGSRTGVDADNCSNANPLTGEPDAGDPPVRFGGMCKVQSLVTTPIVSSVPIRG